MMKHVLASVFLLFTSSNLALAELAVPKGPVILEILGQIGIGNAEDANGNPIAQFDLDGLTLLPQVSLETRTEWTEGLQFFEGVLLRDILSVVDASGEQIRAIALNDFEAMLPFGDAHAYDVLLAFRHNGNLMPVRNKGPIWIIYPSNEDESRLANPHNMKMVWQLSKLLVE
jgi:hypothetical protein